MGYKFALLISLTTLLASCSSENDCRGFPSDYVKKIVEIKLADKTTYLYLRTAGFQDKQFFYELYDKEPSFNTCGVASIKPILEDHVFTKNNYATELVVRKNNIEIVYSDIKPENYDLEKIVVKVEE